jgi:putative aldouronate transport system permease protein
MIAESKSRKVFLILNSVFLCGIAFICLLPLINILAISFSSSSMAASGAVKLWPIGFNVTSYSYVFQRDAFWKALLRSFERVALGVSLNMFLIIIIGYPLSKEAHSFRMRTVYVWFFFITMLFSGGLIPGYLLIQNLKMMNSIWALVLPGAVPVYSVILMLNFFRGIPREMEEAALMDGANHWKTLWRIYVPMSMPAIATLTLFAIVNHWNSWFDGLIFSNFPDKYPLQSYLQTIVIQPDISLLGGDDWMRLRDVSDRTIRCAQIFMGILPVLCVYPFLQKYFVKGIVVGSVKG